MEEYAGSDLERRSRVDDRVWKGLALLAALLLALGVGAVAGGSLVFGLTRMSELFPVARAQWLDSESGIVIASVAADGPAAQAGVVRGDILLAIDNEPLANQGDLLRLLGTLRSGDEVGLTVLHGDELRRLTARLGSQDGHPYLGVAPCGGLTLERGVQVHLGSPGAIISEVLPDSPAQEAGLQAGEIIVAVAGQGLSAAKGLADLIAEYEPGDTVTLEVERPGGGRREVTVNLGPHPENGDAAYLGVRYSSMPHFEMPGGLGPEELKEFENWPFAVPEGGLEQGAIILTVAEGSPASTAGLEAGDVIRSIDGEPVAGPQMLVDAVARREPGDRVTLTVIRSESKEEGEIEVTLGQHPDEEDKAYLGVSIVGFLERRRLEGSGWSPELRFDRLPHEYRLPLDALPFDPDKLPFHLDELPFDLDKLPFDWDDLRHLDPEDRSA